MVNEFTKEAINALKDKDIFDSKAASSASPQHGLSNAELTNSIIESVKENNLAKAEDALNVIANTGDRSAYLAAFDIYKKALLNVKEVEACKCDLIIKNAKNSKHPICGHLGLPINKVYTDKQGNCRPLFRRNQEGESFEVGTYMTAKILGF